MEKEKITFDYSKLKGKIVEVLGNQKEYAKVLGLSDTSVTNKLNNDVYFSQREIIVSVEVLGIPLEEINTYFFTRKVVITQL